MQLDIKDLWELLKVIDQTKFTEFSLKVGELELFISRQGPSAPSAPASPPPPVTLVPTPEPAPPVPEPAPAHDWVEIKSLIVGTFYRAPAPNEPPFVEVGDSIRLGQTVCVIEAMKVINDVEAEVSGRVMEILVQNGEPVEYGQTLMRIDPHL